MEAVFLNEGILGAIILALASAVIFLYRENSKGVARCETIHREYSDNLLELLERTLKHGNEISSSLDSLGETFSTEEVIVRAIKEISERVDGKR